jgi:ribosome maturation factor RimP
VDDPIPGAWNLEVSSAGIDRPLTREKDWNRFSGHMVRAEVNIPVDGRKRFVGIVLGAADGHGRMRIEDGTEVALPLAEIRRARLVLTDALIAASAQMMGVVHEADDDQVPRLNPDKPVTRQADGKQTGARIGGAKVGGGKTAKAPANKGGGGGSSRKTH